MVKEQQDLSSFPRECEVKAMGKTADDFEPLILSIVRQYLPDVGDGATRTTPSRNGNYTSVTVSFEAQSKEELDTVHQALVDEPRVLYTL